jgi:hypothetical protein
MADWQLFNAFLEAEAEKVHNLGSDTLKIALTNTLPDRASDTRLSDITQITSAGGYAPATVTGIASSQSGGVYTLSHGAVTFTPSGAAFDSARYWVLYNDMAANDELIAFADYGISYATPAGQPWTLNAGTFFTKAQSA